MKAPWRPGKLSRNPAWALTTAGLVTLVSCGVDERGLSFSVGGPSAGRSPTDNGEGASAFDGGTSGMESGGEPSGAGQAGEGGMLGEPGGNGGSSGGSSQAGSAGSGGGDVQAGQAGQGGEPPLLMPCDDLNGNGVSDCDETVVANSRFDANAALWMPEALLVQEWVQRDARNMPGSGALAITNTNANPQYGGFISGGTRQCVPAWGKENFEFAAKVFIASGQGDGKAAIDLYFYGADECIGDAFGGATVGEAWALDEWVVLRGKVKIPAATRSMQVRLAAQKPFPQAQFEVLFDDILVRKQ